MSVRGVADRPVVRLPASADEGTLSLRSVARSGATCSSQCSSILATRTESEIVSEKVDEFVPTAIHVLCFRLYLDVHHAVFRGDLVMNGDDGAY
jgi:hypothetical protein